MEGSATCYWNSSAAFNFEWCPPGFCLQQAIPFPDQQVNCSAQNLNIFEPPSIWDSEHYPELWEPTVCLLSNVTYHHRVNIAGGRAGRGGAARAGRAVQVITGVRRACRRASGPWHGPGGLHCNSAARLDVRACCAAHRRGECAALCTASPAPPLLGDAAATALSLHAPGGSGCGRTDA